MIKKISLICVIMLGLRTTSAEPAGAMAARKEPDELRVKELSDLKFGMFICWSFSTFSNKEWTRGIKDVSFFNPNGMDTDQWAHVAKQAGMGYMLFLTKHHDGFCLWDTKTTEWKVTNSPLGKDVLAAVRKSCDKHGLKLALYFSEGDWTWIDPNRIPDVNDSENPAWRTGQNVELKKAQLRELLTRYGPIEFLWMDHAQSDGGLNHKETTKWVHKFQPDCFVGFNHGQVAGRLRLGEMGRPGPLDCPDAAGPYNKVVSEQYLVGEFAIPILGDKGRWFYTNPDNDNLCRSARSLYQLYTGAVKYGNLFSLDVAPDRSGRLRDIDVQTLQKVGRMIKNPPKP